MFAFFVGWVLSGLGIGAVFGAEVLHFYVSRAAASIARKFSYFAAGMTE